MRILGECRAPGVQHGRDTDPRAEALGVVGLQPTGLSRGGNGDQGLGRDLEQQVIDDRLVLLLS